MRARKHNLIIIALFIIFLTSTSSMLVRAKSSFDVWDGTVATSYESGEGTLAKPYIIKTASQFAYFAQQVNAGKTSKDTYVKLDTDIDLGGLDNSGNGIDSRKWTPIGSGDAHFQGTFDGGNHTIKGLYINSPESDRQGLFGYAPYTYIYNLIVEGKVTGKNEVGGIAGYCQNFENCISRVTVIGERKVGGIAGTGGEATLCKNEGTIKGLFNVGGISGYGGSAWICGNIGNVIGNKACGGIYGLSTSQCTRCYNDAIISGEGDDDVEYIGGIVGRNSGAVNKCYNLKKPQFGVAEYVGGIVGINQTGNAVTNCFYYGETINENTSNKIGIITNGDGKKNCYYLSASLGGMENGQRALMPVDFKNTTSFNDWTTTWSDMVMGKKYPQLFLEDWMVTIHDASSPTAKDAYISFNTSVGEVNIQGNDQWKYSESINMNTVESNSVSAYKNNNDEEVHFGAGDTVTITKNGRSLTFMIGVEGQADVSFSGVKNGKMVKNYGDTDYIMAATVSYGHGVVTYESSNPDVADVDSDTGVVTILSVGETEISASVGAEKKASYTLTVYPKDITCEVLVDNRKYEENNRTVSIKSGEITDGVLKGDEVKLDFSNAKAIMDDAFAGTKKKVKVLGIKLSGKSANNYTILSATETTVDILKADKAIYPSAKSITVKNDVKTVKEVTLASGWKWSAADETKQLTEGKAITVTAEYVGADKDCYEIVTDTLTIIRQTASGNQSDLNTPVVITTKTALKKGNEVKDNSTGTSYTITSTGKNSTVTYNSTTSNITTIAVPDEITINNKKYKVTEIKTDAFKNNKKLTKVVIGKNIKKIGKNAFCGCVNLKDITIKTTKLTKKAVGKNAFKNINKKAVVKVPKSKLKSYTKILKNVGVKGKKQTIKKA